MSHGSNENPSIDAMLERIPGDRAFRAAEQAQLLHEAVRSRAGLHPNWNGIGQNLRDFYLRLALDTDARRVAFFGGSPD